MLPQDRQAMNPVPMENYNSKVMADYYSNEYSHQGSAVIASSEHVTTSKDQEAMPYSSDEKKMLEDLPASSPKKTDSHMMASMPTALQPQKVVDASPAENIATQKLDSIQLQNENLNFAVKSKRTSKQYEKGQAYYQKINNRAIPPQQIYASQTPHSGQSVPQGPPQGNYQCIEPNRYMTPSPYSPYNMYPGARNMHKCELSCCVPPESVKPHQGGKTDKSLKKTSSSLLPSSQPGAYPSGPSPNNLTAAQQAQRETFFINKITNNYYQIGKNQKTPSKTATPQEMTQQTSSHQKEQHNRELARKEEALLNSEKIMKKKSNAPTPGARSGPGPVHHPLVHSQSLPPQYMEHQHGSPYPPGHPAMMHQSPYGYQHPPPGFHPGQHPYYQMPPHGQQGYPPHYMGQHYPPHPQHHQMMPMSVYQQHGQNSHPSSHPMCSHQPIAYPSSTMTVTPGERMNSQHGGRQSVNQHAHSRDDSLSSERKPSHQSDHTHTQKSSSVAHE